MPLADNGKGLSFRYQQALIHEKSFGFE